MSALVTNLFEPLKRRRVQVPKLYKAANDWNALLIAQGHGYRFKVHIPQTCLHHDKDKFIGLCIPRCHLNNPIRETTAISRSGREEWQRRPTRGNAAPLCCCSSQLCLRRMTQVGVLLSPTACECDALVIVLQLLGTHPSDTVTRIVIRGNSATTATLTLGTTALLPYTPQSLRNDARCTSRAHWHGLQIPIVKMTS